MIELKKTPEGIILPVRAQPGAKRDGIVGEWAGSLKIQVRAIPEKGKANEAIIELLAERFKLRKATLRIVSGEFSRDKKVLIQGITEGELERLCTEAPL